MRKFVTLFVFCLPALAQLKDQPPSHLFSASEPLTAPSAAPARAVAQDYIRTLAPTYGLAPEDLAGLYVAKEYRTQHNGVTHLVFRQQFRGIDVYNAEWTMNIDRDGRVINAGGALCARPAENVAAPTASSGPAALHAALQAVRPLAPLGYLGLPDTAGKSTKLMKFARGGFADEIEGQPVWFRINGILRPAWVFYVLDENGIDNYATVVDAVTERILARQNLTLYQSAPRGLVFERQSPQPNPTPGIPLTAPPPYVQRTLQPFAGDPAASPRGWVSGNQTAGNNVVAAPNPLGITFLATATPTVAPAGDFSFPLELGPGAPNPILFRDAATTNLFYWANRAHDLFYQVGFDEAAGNFQQENFHRSGVGGDPMIAFSHFGAAANARASLNNAFFTSFEYGEDGVRASINMYIGGRDNIFSDGSYDAEVIIHEYTHGVSSRLVRQNYDTYQGGAMGEGWSDFFALEFTLPEGAPLEGSYPQGEYLFQQFGAGIRTRPYSTSMDVNPLTFKSLGHVTTAPEVHADGEIWAQALWEMRASLIRQFEEKEGRRRSGLLVIDGMKLSPPAPSMVDMRDAILLADRVDFGGASQDQIWSAFARRGLGVLAQSYSADSVHILASFEKPSPVGSMRFYEDQYVLWETVQIVLQDSNQTQPTVQILLTTSSGDLESLVLRRTGSVYLGSIYTSSSSAVTKYDSVLEVIPADYISAYYLDPDTGGGAARLIETTVPTQPEYYGLLSVTPLFVSGEEKPLFTIPTGVQTSGLSTRQTLPFAFPFFGNKYTSIRVYSDGLLTFDIPRFATCSDWYGLALTNGIAPLWMEVVYGGSAQKDENVYMSAGPGSVTFRWAAETQPFNLLVTKPGPVNFSATLFDDGRIQFQYGEGNKNLIKDSYYGSIYGCTASAPTVGISNGHETYVGTSGYHDGNPDLEKAPSLMLEPPFGFSSFPVVKVESPASDEHYQGLLIVKGIAYDETSRIARLDVLVDGVWRARISASISRTDFCNTQRVRGCPNVGFSTNLNLSRLGIPPGTHTLQIRATNSRGAFLDFPDAPVSFFVDAGEPRPAVGAIEAPAEGAALSETVRVKGYAYSNDLRILGVDVVIDGITYGAATYNQKRDDICGPLAVKPPNCPYVGFTFNLDTRTGAIQLPNGKHTLQLRTRDETTRYTLIPETPLNIVVNNALNQPPMGVLASPKPNQKLSGTIKVSGHAWDADGKVSSVDLLVDGSVYMTLRYGLPRPEECTQLTGVAACPNIGFEGDFDTRQLSNGAHALGVRITDNQKSATIVPNLIRNGMNVIVEN